MFLDSDDYLAVECLESCIKVSKGMNVVWFDFLTIFDKDMQATCSYPTLIENFGYDKEEVIDNISFICRAMNIGYSTFWLSYGVFVNFAFLQTHNIVFLNGVNHEDHLFGITLFALSKKIFILPKKLYIHYVRPASITTILDTQDVSTLSTFLLGRYVRHKEGYSDTKSLKAYDTSSSMFLITEYFIAFSEEIKDNALRFLLQKAFLPWFINESFNILDCKKDTLNLLPRFSVLVPYTKDMHITTLRKCAMHYPRLLPFLRVMRYIERKVRLAIKGILKWCYKG